MNEEAIEEILGSFYCQSLESILAVLEWYLESPYIADPGSASPMMYLFARMAQIQPELTNGYANARDNSDPDGSNFVEEILDLTNRYDSGEAIRAVFRQRSSHLESMIGEVFSANWGKGLPSNITTGNDLDLLWAEFSVTGSPEVISPILEVLSWPGLLRKKLEGWIARETIYGFGWYKNWQTDRVVRRLQELFGIDLKLKGNRIISEEDLDLMLPDIELSEFRKSLGSIQPFAVSDAEAYYLGAKRVAKSSVASYARRQPRIYQYCKEQANFRNKRVKAQLHEIVGEIELARREYTSVVQSFEKLLLLAPGRKDIQTGLELATSELELDIVMDISWDQARSAVDSASAKQVVSKCEETIAGVRAYRSKCVISDPNSDGRIENRLDVVLPDKFHVCQSALPSGDFDEWVTIGNEHWRVPFGLMPKFREQDLAISESLTIGRFIEVLREAKPVELGSLEVSGKEYIAVVYDLDHIPGTGLIIESSKCATRAEFIIDGREYYLVKVRIDGEYQRQDEENIAIQIEQVFTNFNENIPIDSPESRCMFETINS